MSSTDKLKMLAGLPIEMSDSTCLIYPKTLKQIALMGVEKYFRHLNILIINKHDVEKMTKISDLEPFDFIIMNSIYYEDFKNEIVESIKFFVEDDVLFIEEMESFVIGKFEDSRFLDKNNFKEFQNILKNQHFLDEKNKSTGENEIAKEIKKKIAKGREKIARIKGNTDTIELVDLVGSLTINTSLDIDRIWNISYYAFNDQFKRMRFLEQYDTSLQSIMAGADPKKIKLEDWIKSIQ